MPQKSVGIMFIRKFVFTIRLKTKFIDWFWVNFEFLAEANKPSSNFWWKKIWLEEIGSEVRWSWGLGFAGPRMGYGGVELGGLMGNSFPK
jgi:hypothetical protein